MTRWQAVAVDMDALLSGKRGHPCNDAPTTPGVYAFYENGKVVYVGSSVNVSRRIRQHLLSYERFRHYAMKVRPSRRYGDWLMIELRLIKRLNPLLNLQRFR